MSAKPGTPITRKEMYLDVMTGGSSSLPEPVTIEEKYLAKIAGMTVDLPAPVPLKHKFLAKIAGMQVDVPTYTTGLPRIYAYLAKAAGQDVNVPQPITREEMYWFDYAGGQPTPSEQEYTGAVPVTFIANGQPLLDYLIRGNTVQSGTPTPDNPIMPQGTGERTGNLLDISTVEKGRIDNGVVGYASATTDLSITGNKATFTTDVAYRGICNKFIEIPSGAESISFSGTFQGGNGIGKKFVFYDAQKSWLNADITFSIAADSGTATIPNGAKFVRMTFAAQIAGTASISNIMLNTGSTPLPYEPYGYKLPISSANTTTSVYLGEVETTRKIKKLVLTGQEGWQRTINEKCYYINMANGCPVDYLKQTITTSICSHYQSQKNTASGSNEIEAGHFCFYTGGGFELYIGETTISSAADFKTYLQQQYANGTPVTVWYVLATPETGIVNEPLMKIGDYADTVSMEQAGVEIPTVNGSNTLDVLTTVKPSEVYIKYKGEPVAGSQTSLQSSAYAPAEVSGQSENIDDIKEEETE